MAVGERPYGVPQHDTYFTCRSMARLSEIAYTVGRSGALCAGGTRLAPTEAERRLVGARSAEQSV